MRGTSWYSRLWSIFKRLPAGLCWYLLWVWGNLVFGCNSPVWIPLYFFWGGVGLWVQTGLLEVAADWRNWNDLSDLKQPVLFFSSFIVWTNLTFSSIRKPHLFSEVWMCFCCLLAGRWFIGSKTSVSIKMHLKWAPSQWIYEYVSFDHPKNECNGF